MKTALVVLLACLLGTILATETPANKTSITVIERGDVRVIVMNRIPVKDFHFDIDGLDRISWPQAAGEIKILVVTIEQFYDSVGGQDLIEVTLKAYHGEKVSYERHIFLSPALPKSPSDKDGSPKSKNSAGGRAVV